jgi:hypothetical protein
MVEKRALSRRDLLAVSAAGAAGLALGPGTSAAPGEQSPADQPPKKARRKRIGKYHVGTQKFSWAGRQELFMGPTLGAERKVLTEKGNIVCTFDQGKEGLIPFVVKRLETALPAFEVSVGKRGQATRFSIPRMTFQTEKFDLARGWLDQSTGDFVLDMRFNVTPKDVPQLSAMAKQGAFGGSDQALVTVHLFERGNIDGDTGRLQARGTSYVTDKEWRKPGDPAHMVIFSFQDPTPPPVVCNLEKPTLDASLTKTPPDDKWRTFLIVCQGTQVWLRYDTKLQNAAKQEVIGTDGSSYQVKGQTGVVAVLPQQTGYLKYHVHVEDSNGCKADSEEITVVVVGTDERFHLRAEIYKAPPAPGHDVGMVWAQDLRNVASPSVWVDAMSIDPDPNAARPVTQNGIIEDDWLAFTPTGNIGHVRWGDKPIPVRRQLANLWAFYAEATTSPPITPSDPNNKYADFLFILNCRGQ